MSTAATTTEPTQPYGERVCSECHRTVAAGDQFCPGCGTKQQPLLVPANGVQSAARRRLGGSPWAPEASENGSDYAELTPLITSSSQPSSKGKARRRRRRRRWFRRPVLVVPLVIAILCLTSLTIVAYRAESTIDAIHRVSSPPPIVSDATLDSDPIWSGVQVETGPAQDAMRMAAATRPELRINDDSGPAQRIQSAATNLSDLVQGAAVASGVSGAAGSSYTILLMGVDARPGEPIDIAVRPDVLAVLRLNSGEGTCHLLAIPRDTRVPLPGYGDTKINHALMVGGIPYQRLVVEDFLDIHIDHYLLVDFVAFEKLVDAVGGIDIDVPDPITTGGHSFERGVQRVDGAAALSYARYRHDANGDIGRIHRQWAVLKGLADATSGRDLVRDVNTLLPTLEDHLRTDLTTSELASIAQTYGGRCSAETTETALLQGTRVRMSDAILDQFLYYNVVTEERIAEQVQFLMGTGNGRATAAANTIADSLPPAVLCEARRRLRFWQGVTHDFARTAG